MTTKLLTILPTFLIFVILILAGTIPNPINEQDYFYANVGNTRIFTYKFGLALYEKGSKLFYNVSPFDMYYLEPFSSEFQKYIGRRPNKSSIFSWNDNLLSAESSYNNIVKKIYRGISYFGVAKPTATFTKKSDIVKITTAKTGDNMVTFYLSYTALDGQNSPEMSFSLNDNDIIIDDKNNIYKRSEDSKTQSYLTFNQLVVNSIKNYEELPYPVNTKYLILTNPKMTGYYKIYLEHEQAFIDIVAKRVNFSVDTTIPKFNVEIGNYLSDVLN